MCYLLVRNDKRVIWVLRSKKMTSGIFRVMLVAAAVSVFAVSAALSEDVNAPAEPETVTVQGTVSVEKNAVGVITTVMLMTEDEEIYNVILDEKGMELGSKMEGKKVEVQGIVMEKEEMWIKVVSCKEIKQDEA